MTPEILIVGDPAGRRPLADTIAASGYGVALCSPRELNRRVRTSSPPTVIIACMGDVDPDVLLAGLRRTRAGASIPVILYGRLGGSLRDLADVLDIGADHFIEEPAGDGELEDALAQYAGPPRDRVVVRGDDEDRGRAGRRPSARRHGTERLADGERDELEAARERPRPRAERGKALGELHRTLDRLDAQLRADDHRSDPELAGLGLDGIPDVDPPDEALPEEEPMLTDIGEHLRGRPSRDPVRGDELTQPSVRPFNRGRERERDPDEERPRPRAPRRDPTARLGVRTRDPDEDTGPGRRSWREPAGDEDSRRSERSGERTRPWGRPEAEGPLRRDREPPSSVQGSRPSRSLRGRRPSALEDGEGQGDDWDEDRRGSGRSRGSAVLRARRPDRDAFATREAEPDRDALRELLRPGEPESARTTGRYDPHARGTPWPTDDFDPSESTMIRRERGDATTRRRSLGDPRKGSWGGGARDDDRGRTPTHVRARPPDRREGEEPRVAARTRRATRRRDPREASSPLRAEPPLRIEPSMPASGKLGPDVDVPAVLWAVHEQRFTGKLRLTRQRIEKQIWLHDGEAVFARSTATSDRLVDGLLRRGVLTRPQYETARRLAAKEPRRAGELLVDAGFLKARELDVLLRDHLARVIDSTFVWTDGGWSTDPGERTDEPIQLEVPMAALILDGVRYRCDASELEDRLTRRIGGRGALVPRLRVGGELGDDPRAALAELIDELGESFRLLPEEESWLRRFDGRHGVAALLADGADEQALFALLFTLELGGYVDLRGQVEPAVESDRDPAQVDGERILERLRLAREGDYFELLGVGRDASRGEIRQAYADLMGTFGDEGLEEESRRRLGGELRELRAALEEAREVLGDDAMRSAYLAHLGED